MALPNILELLIALGMFYFLFSTLVSILFEWYAHKTEKRGRFLYETLHRLLQDPLNKNYGALLYSHFSIVNLRKDGHSHPQYISAEMFADVLIDVIGKQAEEVRFPLNMSAKNPTQLQHVALVENRITDPFERYCKGVETMHYSPLKSMLRGFGEKSTNYNELKTLLMKWYEDYMARVTGWYKIQIKNTLIGISALVCVALNVDSIAFIKKVNNDDQFRQSLVTQAEKLVAQRLAQRREDSIVKGSSTEHITFVVGDKMIQRTLPLSANDSTYVAQINAVVKEIQSNAIPIGYTEDFHWKQMTWKDRLLWVLGLCLSTLALSFGAPFWFEVLVKAVNIRRAGIKPNA
jgi:hypothetical protein